MILVILVFLKPILVSNMLYGLVQCLEAGVLDNHDISNREIIYVARCIRKVAKEIKKEENPR